MDRIQSPAAFHQRLDDLDARIRRARDGCRAETGRQREAEALEAKSASLRGRLNRTPDSEWEKVGDDLHRDWEALTETVEHWIVTVGRDDARR